MSKINFNKIDINKIAKSLQAAMESVIVFANVMDSDKGFFDDLDKYLNRDISLRTTREVITGRILEMKSKYIEIQTKDGDIGRFKKKDIVGIMQA